MRKIKKAIIHCSASDIDSHDDINVIRQWHIERGFNDVGYHFFIKNNGVIEKGRDIHVVGAHCKGENTNSVGICLHGNKQFSNMQFMALSRLLESLVVIFPEITIHGHNEFSSKTCPNFDVTPYKSI
jgi:N-acetyl-anhydromuramyl-L-alanine amidase AmpD